MTELFTCKHCGLAIRREMAAYEGYIHIAAINLIEMITCSYANTATGNSPSLAMHAKYPTKECQAMPINNGGVKQSIPGIPSIKVLVHSLPPVTGRKFR